MSDPLLDPLRTAILSAQCFPDADLRRLAIRRYYALNRALGDLPPPVQLQVDRRIHAMLPSDWPLWVESCRLRRQPGRRPSAS